MPEAVRLACTLCLGALVGCSAPAPSPRPDTTPPPIDPAAIPDAELRFDPILPAGNTSPYSVHGQQYRVMSSAQGYVEEGVASWYGLKFHGRPTANGERFSVYGPTGAHRSLPIPTLVRVTNLENRRSMIVRVNDRGPFHPGRLIDLSYGAALRLGFAEQGTARVRVEALDSTSEDRRQASTPYRTLQIAAFSVEASATALAQQATQLIATQVTVNAAEVKGQTLFRVQAGPFVTADALRTAQAQLRAAGLPEGRAVP